MSSSDLILAINYAVLGYFLLLNGSYVVLYVISFVEISDHARREVVGGLSLLLPSIHAPPALMIGPAYSEEATNATSVPSFLALHYPLHYVVVDND